MATKHFGRRMAATMAVALVVSLGTAAGTAWAYYTDTNRATGMISFKYDPNPPSTEITEERDGLNKIITVTNTGEVDAMVRVKVFAPSIPGVTVTFPDGIQNGWTNLVEDNDEENWWYYFAPLAPDETTPALNVNVTIAEDVDQDFDIVVVQQAGDAKLHEPYGMTLGTFADGVKKLSGPNASLFSSSTANSEDGE